MGAVTAARQPHISRIYVDVDAEAEATVLLNGYLALAGLDPATQVPDAVLIETAMRYARAVDPAGGALVDVVAWARYAYRAARTLHGIYHPRTVAVTEALIWALYSRGLDREACTLRRELIQLHLDHGDTAAHLTARVDLASQLHGAGRCATAIQAASAGWETWIDQFGAHHPAGLTLVLQLAGLLAGCRRVPEALHRIEQARPLYPSPGDPARTQANTFVRTLVMTAFHHRSVCTAHRGSDDHESDPRPDAAQLADLTAVWTDLLP